MALPDFLIDQLSHPRGPLAPATALLLEGMQAATILAAMRALRLRPGERVVEVGFGGGLSLAMMLRAVGKDGQIFTIESSPELLTMARRLFIVARMQGRLRLERARVEALPLGAGVFDAALSLHEMAACADLDVGMRELARVLRVGGRLVLGLPDPQLLRRGGFAGRGARLIDPQRFADKLEGWGFATIEVRTLADRSALIVGERLDQGQDE